MKIVPALFLALALSSSAQSTSVDPSALSNCLASSGMKFYTAWWCPYCKQQLKTLREAGVTTEIIACYPEGGMQKNALCTERGVKQFPTWESGTGERALGAMTLTELWDIAGCTKEKQ